MDYSIEGLTLAVTNMDRMLKFYSEIFHINFEEIEMFGATLYSGKWAHLNLLLCPASIAQNSATQNRHQFDIVVFDLETVIEQVKKLGGKIMGEISEDEFSYKIGIYDPDGNSMVFKKLK